MMMVFILKTSPIKDKKIDKKIKLINLLSTSILHYLFDYHCFLSVGFLFF